MNDKSLPWMAKLKDALQNLIARKSMHAANESGALQNVIDPNINDQFPGKKYPGLYPHQFDAVYCALHPFIHIPGVNPLDARPRVMDTTGFAPNVELINKAADYYRDSMIDVPTLREMQKQSGKVVPWQSICDQCGFANLKHLYRAILPFGRVPEHERLVRYCDHEYIFLPEEDVIPPSLEQSIAIILNLLGTESVILSDELGSDLRTVSVTQLLGCTGTWTNENLGPTYLSTICSSDQSFLISVGHGDFFTKICSTKNVLSALSLDSRLEGFWLSNANNDEWWVANEE